MSRRPESSSVVVHPAARRGLTLIEVLVVVGIIALLAALTVGAIAVFGERAKVGSTRTTLTLLDQAVSAYTDATGRPISFGDSADGEFELLLDEPHLFTVTHLLGEIGRSSAVRDYVARIEPRFIFRYNERVDLDGDGTLDPIEVPEWIRVADPRDPNTNGPGGADPLSFYDGGENAELDGKFAVLDAWGTPIRAVHHGPTPRDDVSVAEVDLDEDGTLFLGVNQGVGSSTLSATQAVEAIYGRCRDRRVLFVSAGPDRRFGDVSADPESELFSYTLDNVYSYEIDRSSSTDSGANP